MVNKYGHHFTMYGLFGNFCLGQKMCQRFGAFTGDSYSSDDMDELETYLCRMQCMFENMEDISTRMVLPSPSGKPEEGLSISLICIKDGKVNDFDYISEAGVLGIMDMDNEDMAPVLIPFKQVWKILPEDVFFPLDELQFLRQEELTVDMVHEMMERARHLQPEDLHYKPSFPGVRLDGKQNTFILMWNPVISSVTLEDHNDTVATMLTEYYNWSVWEHEKAKCGDRFFLIRVGEGNTAIVMSGVFDSNPYEAGDWSGKGRQTFFMDMTPNVVLDPERAPMVTTEELQKAIPSFDWTGGHSGRMLSQKEANTLETIWEEYLAKHGDNAVGETMNVVLYNH